MNELQRQVLSNEANQIIQNAKDNFATIEDEFNKSLEVMHKLVKDRGIEIKFK